MTKNKTEKTLKRKLKSTARKKFCTVKYRKYKNFLTTNEVSDKKLIAMVFESIEAKNWYRNSFDTINRYFGDNSELFIDILSATSPRVSVKYNVIFALRAYNNITSGYEVWRKGQIKFGLAHPIIEKNLRRISHGEKLSGRKVNDFRKALLGDGTRVVVDVWMLRVFGLNKKSPCESDYDFIEYKVSKIARLLNMEACEVQACLWVSIKKQSSIQRLRTGTDFADYLHQLLDINLELNM